MISTNKNQTLLKVRYSLDWCTGREWQHHAESRTNLHHENLRHMLLHELGKGGEFIAQRAVSTGVNTR